MKQSPKPAPQLLGSCIFYVYFIFQGLRNRKPFYYVIAFIYYGRARLYNKVLSPSKFITAVEETILYIMDLVRHFMPTPSSSSPST